MKKTAQNRPAKHGAQNIEHQSIGGKSIINPVDQASKFLGYQTDVVFDDFSF